MAEEPTPLPEWASEPVIDPISGQLNYVEPPTERKVRGFDRREVIPRQWLNWNFRQAFRWLEFFRDTRNRLDAFTVADLPDASGNQGLMVLVTNETGGSVPAFSDGTDWRRVTDREVVS